MFRSAKGDLRVQQEIDVLSDDSIFQRLRRSGRATDATEIARWAVVTIESGSPGLRGERLVELSIPIQPAQGLAVRGTYVP